MMPSHTPVPLLAPPLQPCSSTPHPHPRSGASNRQMSTFPGAVRSGLLGDRDKEGEIDASSAQAGWDCWAPKRWVLSGQEPHWHRPIVLFAINSLSSLPLCGDGELATIQEDGTQFSPPPRHKATRLKQGNRERA